MYRSALRSTPRAANAIRQSAPRSVAPRRFASTSPADKKRSWKSSAVRWGLALGAVYWYSTSPTFTEEPLPQHVAPPPQFSDDDLPTVEAVVAQKRREAEERSAKAAALPKEEVAVPAPADGDATAEPPAPEAEAGAPMAGGPEALEAEADQQGAFNPETGEINWDCPCLGGMADGPCGEEFKAAFSCFVYSKEEPKGMDCIDKFQHMQDCFRLHPEVYGDELADDEEEARPEGEAEAGAAATKAAPAEAGQPIDAPTAAAVDAKNDVTSTTPAHQVPAGNSEQKPASTGPASGV
ncbi:hypothetical protein JX265_012395 [Neoarthrinium moseri]|uniref:Mitochondrial intermembrane space import and assembly protein 40 n=1 Tax=Neoarthrinium moseri TaxID=1658444 RepID=A0A9P9WAI9_9PEZI|nr:uncharacterized protein JN550_011158 [Neoarthrinium moseri]KAI1851523.1 hypothetical protein JX266_002985 [Neoarthrinium moseri]KAI1855040.1 hypothetical protein JX265_012395 [Neoarthrinium moseri]KAI1860843.1 hypothetical protein JN550_011158 [Neoarthrinium moseri]